MLFRAKSSFWQLPVVPARPVDLAAMSVFRGDRFPPDEGPVPWLDRPDAETLVAERRGRREITAKEAELCLKWAREGYVILEGFYSRELMDATWAEYEAAIASGHATPPPHPYWDNDTMPGRLLNVHCQVPAMDDLFVDPRMGRVISILLGAKSLPFQTIVGHKGSQQRAHSDSVHMSTYPAGYLAANWIAFEDIDARSGPLFYYPGSHRLPYLLSEKLGIAVDAGEPAYRGVYEPAIERVIEENGLKPVEFLAKKGDVLIWHANLLHGGSPLKIAGLSRKALVCHYFAEGVVTYHDLTGTLSYVQLGQDLYKHRRPPPAPNLLHRALDAVRRRVGA